MREYHLLEYIKKRINHMDEEMEMMSAEEFFGEPKTDKTPSRRGKAHGNRLKKDIFTELKVKMVMRIYGVSKTRACEIIAGRAAEKEALEDANSSDCGNNDEIMSAEEFFGGCK